MASRSAPASTISGYTGNTPQTGDAFSYLGTNLGSLGANLSHVSANATQFAGQTITCGAGVTVGAFVGSTRPACLVYGRF